MPVRDERQRPGLHRERSLVPAGLYSRDLSTATVTPAQSCSAVKVMMAQVAHSFVVTPTAPMSTPALRVAAGPRAAAMPISPISALRPPRAGQRAGLRTDGAPGLHMGTLSERRAVSQ